MTHRVSARRSDEMLMQSTADIFSNNELASPISKHILTRFKEMHVQAVCENANFTLKQR